MRYKVHAGTPCTIIFPNHDEVEFVTSNDNIFNESDVVFDPKFRLGVSIGSNLYGFERDGFVLVANSRSVEVLK